VPKLDLEAAKDATIPDVLPAAGDPFRVLFVGINPGLYSAATGWHFARPGNRFWPALHASGFTPRLLKPSEQQELAGCGLGVSNIAPRATAQAAELTPAELREGGQRLSALIAARRPGYVAILGVTAYRTAFARPKAQIGPQPDPLAGARLWVLPNPSGLNASWTAPRIAAAFRELREVTALFTIVNIANIRFRLAGPSSPCSFARIPARRDMPRVFRGQVRLHLHYLWAG
jgi:TDG/mug DNA glycosylase family protein